MATSFDKFLPDAFNEEQWLRFLFLIRDSQSWLDDLHKGLIYQLPREGKKKLLKKTYYLSATAFAHILERHYYKIQRYPYTSKFTIPMVDILTYIRDSYVLNTSPVNGSIYLQRTIDTGKIIGFEVSGNSTSIITIMSDQGGRIITAFPGTIQS